jgi:Leucine-rich repeat (LRR) protein
MKQFITSLLLITACYAEAQIVNIPDANFKAALISLGFDTNNDGEIQQAEADFVINLEILHYQGITDLSGINSFTNLKTINISYNSIPIIDVGGLANLQTLSCSQCAVNTLNVSGLANLQSLNCSTNQITSLNLSGCFNLAILDCSDNNLKVLDLANHQNIESVKLSYDRFFSVADSVHLRLNASNCPRLKTVDLQNSPTSMGSPNIVNLVNCDSLTNLRLYGFLIDTLDISQSDGLRILGTFRGIGKLIARNCLSLTNIYSDAAQIAGIGDADVTGCVNQYHLVKRAWYKNLT